jgi:hypothetical protein
MDKRGRIVGIVVFAVGIAVLVFVFATAYAMFRSPVQKLLVAAEGKASTAEGLGSAVVLIAVKIGLLFVMTLAGSLIASKGIQLYIGSSVNEEKPSRSQ